MAEPLQQLLMRPTFRSRLRVAACAASLMGCAAAHAFQVGITSSSTNRAIYLQVGTGTFTGTYSGTGTPGNNATVNTVSTTVAANAIGAGPQTMGTDSLVANSSYDNFVFCTPTTGQVYVGGFYRAPGTPPNGTLSVSTPANLVNAAGDTLPFSTISWVSGGNGDATPTIPSGTFVGGTSQTIFTVARNNWFESCLTFSYANANLVAAGTFTGRATYTLVAP